MANWENGVTPINEDNINALYDLRKGSEVIADNTDLNTLTTAGTYRCVSLARSQTLLNCPHQGLFKLVVENLSDTATTTLRQTLIPGGRNSKTYIRSNDANGWGNWGETTMDGHAYSTSTKKIGTWIDGKPLYRKVTKSSTFATDYELGISNIADIVSIQAIVHRNDYPNLYNSIPSRVTSSQYFIDFQNINKTNGHVGVLWGSNHSADTVKEITFIVEFTKTTD